MTSPWGAGESGSTGAARSTLRAGLARPRPAYAGASVQGAVHRLEHHLARHQRAGLTRKCTLRSRTSMSRAASCDAVSPGSRAAPGWHALRGRGPPSRAGASACDRRRARSSARGRRSRRQMCRLGGCRNGAHSAGSLVESRSRSTTSRAYRCWCRRRIVAKGASRRCGRSTSPARGSHRHATTPARG